MEARAHSISVPPSRAIHLLKMDEQRTTIRYAGHLLDARNADGKIWFAVDGHATLSRRLRRTRDGQHEKVSYFHEFA